MSIAEHRALCDELVRKSHKVVVSEDHLEGDTFVTAKINDRVVEWLYDRGFRGGGINPDSSNVWIGDGEGYYSKGRSYRKVEVNFHPDKLYEAFIFKMMFGE